MPRRALKRRLVKFSTLRGHSKRHTWIERCHRVAPQIEMSVNRLSRRKRGIQMMPRRQITFEFAHMTSLARTVTDVAALLICARRRSLLRGSRSFSIPRRPIRRLLTRTRGRKTQRHANDQKNRPESPPPILRSHLPLCLSRPLANRNVSYLALPLTRNATLPI